jgi:hypothetical protein
MRLDTVRSIAAVCAAVLAASASPASQAAPPPHHHADVDTRGAAVMGFDQAKTVHHFRLHADGGSIEVAVKDPADRADLEAIRSHLPHIAQLFQQGRFDLPMLVHDTTVPGTAELSQLTAVVRYTYVETPAGGRVDVVTTDAGALAALHRFLAFQIADHRTGDPASITPR